MSTSTSPIFEGAVVAVGVSFEDDALRVVLSDGRELSVPLAWFPRLARASDIELGNWRLIGGGVGIHWEDLDEDLSIAGLLRGVPGPAV